MLLNPQKFILVFALAFSLAWVFSKLVIRLAYKLNILDHPSGDRKIHRRATPLLGGLSVYIAFLLTVLILWQSNILLDGRVDISLIGWFLLGGLVLMINGYLDDKYSLKAYISILGPILASLIVIWGGLRISYITNPNGGIFYLGDAFTWDFVPILITFLWLMGITYTTKLLDGIDGLVSSIGLIASLVIFGVSMNWDVVGSSTSLLALALAGSIFGFLIFNWHPAKVFLGEGGSTFIGFALGVLSIISGSKIATALLVMGLPVLDIFWVIIRRIKQGKAFWHGDQEHLHFRMLRSGFSQRQIVFFMSSVSLAFGVVSIFFTTKIKISALVIVFVLMLVLSAWLNYRLKEKHEEI
jgi:UDP-GlcNAc:undecaprenyl-phosphate/decaprenyl-phosphate GlcNAc-1-phosphate transferase